MNRILIVDDEKDVLEAVSHSLGRRGYNVAIAQSAEEGLEKVKRERFDIVLMDLRLPDMDGMEALRKIKKIDSEIEVIMITAFASIDTAIESMKEGAYEYVEKPLNINKLIVLIEKALEKHQLTETVAFYEVSKAIFSTIEMEGLLKIIVDLSLKLMRADDVSIMLFDEHGKLYIAISHGLDEDIKRNTRLALGEKIAGWVAENKQPMLLINGLKDSSLFKDLPAREEIKSSIIVPLIKNDKVIGILSLNRLINEENFSKIDLYKTNIFGSLASLALDNANLYTSLSLTQEKLIAANKKLEENEKKALAMFSELKETHGQLKDSRLQLSQSAKLAGLGRLVSDMAHEVNNPLMVIQGSAQLCSFDGVSDTEKRKNIGIIISECQRAKGIIQRLLKFSRPSKGLFKDADINASIEYIVGLIEHQFLLSGVRIARDYGRDLPQVYIEEQQMQEVVMNLLNNARDAIEKGGVITVRTIREEKFVRVDFKDSGCGMDKDTLDKIFEPFFTTKEKGTGLGLPVCYGIVKAHNGELRFESQPGKGTTAVLLLPLAERNDE